jgi:hypothetical protein
MGLELLAECYCLTRQIRPPIGLHQRHLPFNPHITFWQTLNCGFERHYSSLIVSPFHRRETQFKLFCRIQTLRTHSQNLPLNGSPFRIPREFGGCVAIKG